MKRFGVILIGLLAGVLSASAAAPKKSPPVPPYKNSHLPIARRVSDLLSRMTLEEKVAQLQCRVYIGKWTGNYANTNGLGGLGTVLRNLDAGSASVRANEIQRFSLEHTRLGIPVMIHEEAVHGVLGRGATSFPQAIGLAATWDTALVHRIATVIGEETRSRGIHQVLSPVINIARDVRWGRVEETYGEDPYLSARMGVAFCEGFENNGVITTPKHFVANVGDGGRDSYPISADERLLDEIDFVPFKACIEEAHAGSVMAAYNSYDGLPCSANHWLLTDVLRNRWRFTGYVVSDYGSVDGIRNAHQTATTPEQTAKEAIDAGLDVEYPDIEYYGKPLLKAVKSGMVKTSTLDLAVSRVLEAKFRLGLFDSVYVDSSAAAKNNNTPDHRALALQAEREALVLLRNEDNILPLKKDIPSIAVIGPEADAIRLGGYSADGMDVVTVLQGIKKIVSTGTIVKFARGCDLGETGLPIIPEENLVPSDTTLGAHGLKGEYFNSINLSGAPVLTRLDKQINFDWSQVAASPQLRQDSFSVRWTGAIVPSETRKYKLGLTSDDGIRCWVNGKLLVDSWVDRGESSDYVTVAFEKGRKYDIKIEYYQNQGGAVARLGWDSFDPDKKEIDDAVAAAKASSVAVIVTGILEGEGEDRADLGLTGRQSELIQAVEATGTPTIVVVMAGSAVTMNPWLENTAGVIDMWYGGEEGGTALAEAIFGDNNPGGRLPVTFPQSIGQVPLYYNHKPTGRGDDYVRLSGKPLYPFGFGMSYTTFQYSDLAIDPLEAYTGGPVHVSAKITNTGSRRGDEVVQLYIHDTTASVSRPVKELKSFWRISLDPSETKTVAFTLTRESLEYPGIDLTPTLDPGSVQILVGSSSADIRLRGQLKIGAVAASHRTR